MALLSISAQASAEPFAVSSVFVVNTSTARFDTDLDGMPDSHELAFGLNPLLDDANSDPDGDGFTNLQEYNAGTNPFIFDSLGLSEGVSAAFTVITGSPILDTDGDGLPDGWETQNGLNVAGNDANEDSDGDGLTNLEEYNGGTSPRSNDSPTLSSSVSPPFTVGTAFFPFPLARDSDGDAMPDWWEQEYGLDPFFNDAIRDNDGDGVLNLVEYQTGGNPAASESIAEVATISASFVLDSRQTRLDSDGDRIPDSWEIKHGLDPLLGDAGNDPDGDGRTNLEEYNAGTDPQLDDWRGPSVVASSPFLVDTGGFSGPRTRDSDGDGIPDWWETQYGLNPEVSDSGNDADGDSISNLDEFNSGSNPLVQDRPSVVGVSSIFLVDTGGRSFDSDGDGLPDWWERLYFNDSRAAVPLADTDGDGHSNRDEFLVGSNPLDANSVFRIDGFQAVREANGTRVVIRWASFEGVTYSIWSATEAPGPYVATAAELPATPPLNTFSVLLPGTNGFVRLGVGP